MQWGIGLACHLVLIRPYVICMMICRRKLVWAASEEAKVSSEEH